VYVDDFSGPASAAVRIHHACIAAAAANVILPGKAALTLQWLAPINDSTAPLYSYMLIGAAVPSVPTNVQTYFGAF